MAAELTGEPALALKAAMWALTHGTNLELPGGEGFAAMPFHWFLRVGRPGSHGLELRARGAGPPRAEAGAARRLTVEWAGEIGAPGFEPGTSCSQSRRATGLRHTPPIARAR